MQPIWKQQYSVFNESIDNQHKKFFQYCERLSLLAEESVNAHRSNTELITLTFKVRTYGFRHFMDEEDLMLKYKYPNLLQHIREHNRYYSQFFNHIEKDYNVYTLDVLAPMDDNSRRIATFLSKFAADWLIQHIISMDKSLGEYLKKNMLWES